MALLDRVGAGQHVSAGEVRAVLGEAVSDSMVDQVVNTAARVARLTRRERELSALMSSARELVQVRDVQDLLQRLVDRAHDLVGADITYLSEYDAVTDELWVRATHGSVSADLPRLRVPAGIGLASKVVRTGVAQWTADYDSETDLPRAREIDAAVAAENMRSLLGVPMVASGHVLGVLFAANRSVHPFSAEEIALLSAFADHAAVMLYTARLLVSERESAAQAASAYARAERHAAAMERAARVHEDLTRVVLAGQGVHQVAETLARSLSCPVAVMDRDFRLTASTSDVPASLLSSRGAPVRAVLRALDESRRTGHCVLVRDQSDEVSDRGLVVAVVAGEMMLGGLLVVPGSDGLDAVERRTVERSAQIVALLTVQQEAVANAEDRVRGELVADLVAGRGSVDEIVRRGRARGIRLDRDLVAVAVRSGRPDPQWSQRLRGALAAANRTWLVGRRGDGAMVLIADTDPAAAADAVYRHLRSAQISAVVVGACAAAPPADIATRAEEAWLCAELLPGLGLSDGVAVATSFAPYLAMFGSNGARARAFIEATVGPILAWDRDHGTDLMATLERFVDCQASVARAARELFVHVNTVKQRLERIATLLGSDWREPEALFRVTVAARLHSAWHSVVHSQQIEMADSDIK